jgi:hypothetical protein
MGNHDSYSDSWREVRGLVGTRLPDRNGGVRRCGTQRVNGLMREAVRDGESWVKTDVIAHRTHLR